MDPGRRFARRVEAGAGEPAVVLEAGMNNGPRPGSGSCRCWPRTCVSPTGRIESALKIWPPITGQTFSAIGFEPARPGQCWGRVKPKGDSR
jgi:hypothetical protein